MKFTKGQWMLKKNYAMLSPCKTFDYSFENGVLTLYLSTRPTENRAQTIDQPALTVRYSAPWKDVIHVQLSHFEGGRRREPFFPVMEDPNSSELSSLVQDGQELIFQSGDLEARIHTDLYAAQFLYAGRLLTASPNRAAAYLWNEREQPFFREQLTLSVGEYVYGLGERFTPFVRNGQTVDMWNEDGGTSSEISYKNIPFYLTSGGLGVFVNHPEEVSFEVASEQVERVQFSVPGEKLDYYLIGGETLKEVVGNFAKLTGKPALPPAWSFGLWLSTSFTTNYDEKTVSSFLDGMAERDIPLQVFHFDCFWMKEFQWCDFEWDSRVFPDPAGMLRRMKDRGLKICVWINPYIAQKSKLFAEGMEKGYFVETLEGDVWQWDKWQAGMALVDFTNPEACQWYQSKLKALLDMGVDCFKTDFGERIPTEVRYCNGADPWKMHNFYTYLYNQTVFDLLKRERGEGEAVLFARSATACCSQFPVHWGGDCWATYESMAESLRGGLSLCMCGFGFWSHDIGGFENTATPDIYKRWAAFGLLSSHSRLHGSSSYRVPWNFDEEAVEVLRFFAKLKCRLMPYLFAQAKHTSETGIPMMRSMILEFEEDSACKPLDLQYMLGDSLLVAPVFCESGEVTYYLPAGKWTSFFTNEVTEGGRYVREQHGYQSIPLMVRPNSLLAVGGEDTCTVYDYGQNVSFHLFELEEDCSAQTTVYGSGGEEELTAKASRSGQKITFCCQGEKKSWKLVLRSIRTIKAVSGGTAQAGEEGVILVPESSQENKVTIVVEF